MQKKFFRPHRQLYADSMAEKMEVSSIKDIIRKYDEDPLVNGYFKNIRIDPESRHPHRGQLDEWGKDTYMVVADFDGYTGQCIGFTNFIE